MKKKLFFLGVGLLFSIVAFNQNVDNQKPKGSADHHHKHKKHHKTPINSAVQNSKTDKLPKITSANNTGSNNGTMPDNNDPGKVTTNPNGKTGAVNKQNKLKK